jgi:hypothetical protein
VHPAERAAPLAELRLHPRELPAAELVPFIPGISGIDTSKKSSEGWIELEGTGIGEVIAVAEDSLATAEGRAEFLTNRTNDGERIKDLDCRDFTIQCQEQIPQGTGIADFAITLHPGWLTCIRQCPGRPEPFNATEAKRKGNFGCISEQRERSKHNEAGTFTLNISRQIENRISIAYARIHRIKWTANKRHDNDTIAWL